MFGRECCFKEYFRALHLLKTKFENIAAPREEFTSLFLVKVCVNITYRHSAHGIDYGQIRRYANKFVSVFFFLNTETPVRPTSVSLLASSESELLSYTYTDTQLLLSIFGAPVEARRCILEF